ncbi:MvaI/BcnI family restriction endonuclease [Chrysiogenes arsenatis]|uniref:MvaI/BcnI family restriction endonuclease n=1 Tax=Chrysiogenes arsenatis TaxID=309797 RepID=UPI0003FD5E3E|nr:MvaI/BcnI family restriction endonuclease [Chrysiogenes arsenatis]
MDGSSVNLSQIALLMQRHGAKKVLFKPLANNDNSKQQIYFGGDFCVLQFIPTGKISSAGLSSKGPIFKAPIDLHWITPDGFTQQAPHAQLILYPKYPEVRLSGMLRGCSIAPSHLLQPPTDEERAKRKDSHRYLILGIRNDSILAYVSAWDDTLSHEAWHLIDSGKVIPAPPVFFEYRSKPTDSRAMLLQKLHAIYQRGFIRSCRLDGQGNFIEYAAKNGAGYTLEAQFGITPNGTPDPDFMDWELKTHSGGAVTLMTPEPNTGTYLECLESFLKHYGTNQQPQRMDFASRHTISEQNAKSGLTITLEGYDSRKRQIIDPNGGLMLRDQNKSLAAGWSFSKLLDHWKRKHANACFVSYKASQRDVPYYLYGPRITLATGTDLERFLHAIYSSTIYYDPGVNMKWEGNAWRAKKRNQFRVAWKNIPELYTEVKTITLTEI